MAVVLVLLVALEQNEVLEMLQFDIPDALDVSIDGIEGKMFKALITCGFVADSVRSFVFPEKSWFILFRMEALSFSNLGRLLSGGRSEANDD